MVARFETTKVQNLRHISKSRQLFIIFRLFFYTQKHLPIARTTTSARVPASAIIGDIADRGYHRRESGSCECGRRREYACIGQVVEQDSVRFGARRVGATRNKGVCSTYCQRGRGKQKCHLVERNFGYVRKNVLHFLSGTDNRNIGAVRRNGNAIVRAVNADERGRPSQGNDFHLARGVSVSLLDEIARVGVCTIRDGGVTYGRTGRHRIICRVFASCQCNCQQKRQIERITFHIQGTINIHSKVDSHSILSASYNESPIYHLMLPE